MSVKNPDLVPASSETWFSNCKGYPKAADFSFSSLPFLIGFLFGIRAVNPEIPGFPKMAKWEIKNPVTEMKNPSDESS